MKIYVLMHYYYDDVFYKGVYSSEDKAQEALEFTLTQNRYRQRENYQIEETVLDE